MVSNIDAGVLGIILTIIFGVAGMMVYSSYRSKKVANKQNFNLKRCSFNNFENINMGNQEKVDNDGDKE